MATPTNLSKEEFIKETKQWGANRDSLIKVRMMKKGEFIYCRLTLPNNGEVIQTRVPLVEFDEFEWMNLNAISIPAVWNDEFNELSKINKKLEELNASTITPSGYTSLWNR
ncbi:hypothetical protein LCGC14_2651210 [marine sediment metagenome]|uniref:Uncharacterized protein n=1 Tax=marine sediment metagenome TaxID=412755 RepID=A0A0F9CLR6_9ZZZZ